MQANGLLRPTAWILTVEEELQKLKTKQNPNLNLCRGEREPHPWDELCTLPRQKNRSPEEWQRAGHAGKTCVSHGNSDEIHTTWHHRMARLDRTPDLRDLNQREFYLLLKPPRTDRHKESALRGYGLSPINQKESQEWRSPCAEQKFFPCGFSHWIWTNGSIFLCCELMKAKRRCPGIQKHGATKCKETIRKDTLNLKMRTRPQTS